jgi:hypothetical protein
VAGVADKRAFLAADLAPKSSHRYCSSPSELGDTAVKVSASRAVAHVVHARLAGDPTEFADILEARPYKLPERATARSMASRILALVSFETSPSPSARSTPNFCWIRTNSNASFSCNAVSTLTHSPSGMSRQSASHSG